MDISVTDFKQRCLEIIRRVETSGEPVAITRRGKVVARLAPCSHTRSNKAVSPWERLRALGGSADIDPEESSLSDEDFEASR